MVLDFFNLLARMAYDLFYPMSIIAQMKFSNIDSFTYINPFSNIEKSIDLQLVSEIANVIVDLGVPDVTVIEAIVFIFIVSSAAIIVGKVLNWLIIGGET